MADKRIKDLTNTAAESDIASGNYFALDGSAGTKKLDSTTLLTKTAQNALSGNVAQAFDPTRTNVNPYKAGESVAYDGKTYTFKVDHYGAWVDADAVAFNDMADKINAVAKEFTPTYNFNASFPSDQTPAGKSFSNLYLPKGYIFKINAVGTWTHFYVNVTINGNETAIYDIVSGTDYTYIFPDVCTKIRYYISGVASNISVTATAKNPISSSSFSMLEYNVENKEDSFFAVKIGSRFYRVCKIGNQLWTSENLAEKIGTLDVDYFIPRNNDEFQKEYNYGYLYPYNTLCSASDVMTSAITSLLPAGSGWRIPKTADLDGIKTLVGSGHSEMFKIEGNVWEKQTASVKDGVDKFGFSIVPSGVLSISGEPSGDGKYVYLANQTGDLPSFLFTYESNTIARSTLYTTNGFAVRFVLDLNADGTLPTNSGVVVKHNRRLPAQFNASKSKLVNNGGCVSWESCEDDFFALSMFEAVGVVGDSYASGVIYNSDSTLADIAGYSKSWPQMLARKFGTIWTNYSKGGLSTRTWLTNSEYGLAKLLSDDPQELYILALGINDTNIVGYLGSITDITSHESYEDYPDTFYGNYGKIIEQIKGHAPNAKLIISTMYQNRRPNTSGSYGSYNNAIIEIAAHYSIPCIRQYECDILNCDAYQKMNYGHPTWIGTSVLAKAFETMICKALFENYSLFKT